MDLGTPTYDENPNKVRFAYKGNIYLKKKKRTFSLHLSAVNLDFIHGSRIEVVLGCKQMIIVFVP